MYKSNRLHELKDLADNLPTLQETVLQDYHRNMAKTHEDFLISMFAKKDCINAIPKKFTLFPKVASVESNGWTFWFADDDGALPQFIVAISQWENVMDTSDAMAVSMKMHFNYITDYAQASKLAPDLFNQIFKF